LPASAATATAGPSRRRWFVCLSIALTLALLAGAAVLIGQIHLRIRDTHGQGADLEVPPRGGVPAPRKPQSLASAPAAPFSPLALVQEPAPLQGLRNWTLETVGHRDTVKVVRYSPDGQWLASAGKDGTVRLWRPGTGELARI